MRVLIFGLNHQIQWSKIWSYSSSGELERFERDQKEHFRELLRNKMLSGELDMSAHRLAGGPQIESTETRGGGSSPLTPVQNRVAPDMLEYRRKVKNPRGSTCAKCRTKMVRF